MRTVFCILLLLVSTTLLAQASAPESSSAWWRDYSIHAQQVRIGAGRTVNLLCEGHGSPTIILESGTGDGMTVWRKVQPVLAHRYHVCAYDRAGLGLSTPDLRHRDLDGIVADLERVMAKAHLHPPYLLVSHSFGGMVLRLFARRHLADVVGMVLVDPPSEGQAARIEKLAPDFKQMVKQQIEHSRRCASAQELTGACEPNVPKDAPAAIAARLRSGARTHFLTQAAEMDTQVNGVDDAEIERAGTNLGSLPLIVLTSEQFKSNEHMPPELRSASQKLWMTLHDEISAHSKHGLNRVVPGTGHYIQLERPDAVIAAVDEVAAAKHHH